MRPQYSITTQPESEPVSYNEAAEHLRVDSDADQSYIGALIPVAREFVDSVTGRVSMVSEWLLIASCWSALAGGNQSDTFSIHRTPLVAVESISYYAPGESVLTVMDAADYRAIFASEPGMVQIIGSFPAVEDRPDAIQIAFTAGCDEAAVVPAIHRHAIKMLVGHLYENRLPVAFASCQNLPYSLEALISNQKIGGWVA